MSSSIIANLSYSRLPISVEFILCINASRFGPFGKFAPTMSQSGGVDASAFSTCSFSIASPSTLTPLPFPSTSSSLSASLARLNKRSRGPNRSGMVSYVHVTAAISREPSFVFHVCNRRTSSALPTSMPRIFLKLLVELSSRGTGKTECALALNAAIKSDANVLELGSKTIKRCAPPGFPPRIPVQL
jgi:hypothetical protein